MQATTAEVRVACELKFLHSFLGGSCIKWWRRHHSMGFVSFLPVSHHKRGQRRSGTVQQGHGWDKRPGAWLEQTSAGMAMHGLAFVFAFTKLSLRKATMLSMPSVVVNIVSISSQSGKFQCRGEVSPLTIHMPVFALHSVLMLPAILLHPCYLWPRSVHVSW